mmetsp:Transcript_14862/g.36456  ORF Transcript_14862/g.36456 Transcript_14862/m.36456 type:complete len:266 (+) Transcript_14862:950-1747(+)
MPSHVQGGQPIRNLPPNLHLLILRKLRAGYAPCQRVQRLQKVDAAVVVGDVHRHDDLLRVRLAPPPIQPHDAQRRVQSLHNKLQLGRADVIRRVRVQLHPNLGEPLHMLLAHRHLFVQAVALEVVQDNRDDQVEHDKRAQDDEAAEEQDGGHAVGRTLVSPQILMRVRPRAVALVQVRLHPRGGIPVQHALPGDHTVVHEAVPGLPRGHAKQRQQRVVELFEVGVSENLPRCVLDLAEEVHAHHGKDEEKEEKHRPHVAQRGQRV